MQRTTVEWADPANTDNGVIIKIPGSAPVTITEGAEIDVGEWSSIPQGIIQHVKVTVIGWSNWGGVRVPIKLFYETLTPVLAYELHRPSMEFNDITSIRLHRDPQLRMDPNKDPQLRMDPNKDPQFQAARRQVQIDEARRRAAEAAQRNIHYGISQPPQPISQPPQTISQRAAEGQRRLTESARQSRPTRGAGNVLKKRHSMRRNKSPRRNKSLRCK